MSISLKNDAGTFSTNINQSNPTANVNIALPTTSGTMALENGNPCFSAYQSAEQTLSNGAWTKVNFQTKEFDTTNAYDTTTNRFTPQKAGYYQVNTAVSNSGNCTIVGSSVWKNGVKAKNGTSCYGSNGPYQTAITSCIIYMNGTSDYLEAFGWLAGTPTTKVGSTDTYFQAHYIGS